MNLSEGTRNACGIVIALMCVVMAAFGLCVICGSVYLKLHMDGWKGLFHDSDYDPEILFLSLLSVGCVVFALHIYGAKHGYATGFVATRQSYKVCFLPLMILMVLLIVGMIVTGSLCLVHRGRLAEGFEHGMYSRMKMYKKDMHVKMTIDLLQMNYGCCGSISYIDWLDISWIDNKYVNMGHPDIERNLENGQYITDNAPFSCCSMESMRPCVYHKVTDYTAHVNYKKTTLNELGCSETLSTFYDKMILYPVLCGMFGGAGVEFLIIVCLRHLQTSIISADAAGYPSGYGVGSCCTRKADYYQYSDRSMDGQGYGQTYDGWDRNYNANIRMSIAYIEDILKNKKLSKSDKSVLLEEELENPKPSKSNKDVILAENTAKDQSKTSNIRRKKWLRKRKGCTNDNTKTTSTAENEGARNANPSKSDTVGHFAEEKIVNDQSKTSNIRTKKWLGQRKGSTNDSTYKDTNITPTAENDRVRIGSPSKCDTDGRFPEETANDQSKTSNIRRKKWLGHSKCSKHNNTNQNRQNSAVSENKEIRNPKPSKSVHFADDEENNQNTCKTNSQKAMLGQQNRKQSI